MSVCLISHFPFLRLAQIDLSRIPVVVFVTQTARGQKSILNLDIIWLVIRHSNGLMKGVCSLIARSEFCKRCSAATVTVYDTMQRLRF
jgi:hypothetical protein